MKKILLILIALTVSAAAFAEKITTVAGITSGNKYYIGATTGDRDFYFYVDGSAKTESIKGVAKEDVADAVALTFTEVTGGWTIQFDNGLFLGLKNSKDNGAVQVMEDPVVWTIEEDIDKGLLKLHPNDYYLQKNNSGTQFGSYKNNQTNVWLEYAGSAPVSPILESVYIKGDATKKEYEVGESFDPAGLEVWGVYTKTVKNDTESQITSGYTWTIDPETFTEASDNASVKLSASYKDKTSEDKTITGIKVNAVVPKMDKTFDFTTNLYGHKGVSSGSGDSYVSDGDIAVGEKFNEDPTQIEFTVNGSTQTRFWDASSKHELRLYNGATFDLSVVGDYKIIKVEFTGSAVNLTGNGVTVSDKVWEGDAVKTVKFVNTATGSKINSIKATYIAADPAAENPTITPSKHDYTITAYLPQFCDAIAAYADSVRVMGGFDNWTNGIWMEKKIDEDFNDCWYAEIKDVEEGTEFKLRFGTDADWAVQVQLNGQNLGNEKTGETTDIVLRYDGVGYGFAACDAPVPGPTVDGTGITVNGRKYGFPVRLVKDVK